MTSRPVVDTTLSWTDLVAVPEVYATAWSALHRNLAVRPGETLLVRGAIASLGQAAVNIAVDDGLRVVATTRDPRKEPRLRELGAAEVLIDHGDLAAQVGDRALAVDAVLDLVGNSVLRDSLLIVRPHGRVCQVGFLGGLAPVDGFNPLTDLPTGVQLSFFGSFVLGTEAFPVDDIPLSRLIARAAAGVYRAKPTRVFRFEDIVEAHRVMESNEATGKMVVAVR
jgi:NADPH2:quinone reductase